MKRVLVVAGTRPEVIKLAPVVQELRHRAQDFHTIYCSTGQHRQMLDQANAVFGLEPDLDLGLMSHAQSLADLTSLLFHSLDAAIAQTKPDTVIVQGDTTSAFVGAMCAFYRKLQVGHVEAGLRTHDMYSPFPEEVNRSIIGRLAAQHFAPTAAAQDNLLREGVSPERVTVTGNTIVDALLWVQRAGRVHPGDDLPDDVISAARNRRTVLVTSHRRESFGSGLRDTCRALVDLTLAHPDIVVIYPVHLNPAVQEAVHQTLQGQDRILLIPPVSYPSLLWLMSQTYLILSDSGGIQEEAPSFSKPLLVLRESTERPEVVDAGCAKLVGTDRRLIVEEAGLLLADEAAYDAMRGRPNPFGDGRAAQRIVDRLTQ